MKIVEKILGGLIIVLIISRLLFSYPFSGLLITLSCILLAQLYFVFGFALLNNIRFRKIFKKDSYNNVSVLRIILTIITGLTLSLLVIYALFKFMRWPYGNFGLFTCLIWLGVIIAVVLIKHLISKDKFYANYLIRLGIIGTCAMLMYLVSSERLLELQYKNFPDFVEAEKKVMKDPQNKQLRQKANEERQKMDLSND